MACQTWAGELSKQFLPPLQTSTSVLHTQASVVLAPATTLWATTRVSALRSTCKSMVATTAWVRSVLTGEMDSHGKSTLGWGWGLLESSGLGRVWRDMFVGGELGGLVYLRCWCAALNKAAGFRDPGLPGMVVAQVVHCPRNANM